ncbi:conserved exported protein of unknown function [Agreia sp. COWG]|nr:conserved exported protein of unknown function [Agreia sp. COWG]
MVNPRTPWARAFVVMSASIAVVAGALVASPAMADTTPTDPTNPATPATVTADALPTVQIDGNVWQQTIIGDTVYAVGKFGTARPAGAARGVNAVVRNNILAYSISTGQLITSFAPSLNDEAFSVTSSPDGSRIYVGGSFTQVNGATVWRIAALDAKTGALITSFLPKPAGPVRAIVATASTVYFGGLFSTVGTAQRPGVAEATVSNGALTSFGPQVTGGRVNGLLLSPDKSKLVIGGQFTQINGSDRPGRGLGMVSTADASLLPFQINDVVRNGDVSSSITSLSSDGDDIYGTGYTFNGTGNFEGTFRSSFSSGTTTWLEDCHGDTYSVKPIGDVVYTASHAHYCGNIGAFPQTDPWGFHRALAFSKTATGTLTPDQHGYPSFTGTPSPSLLTWFPDLESGKATGQNQGPWTVDGNAKYVVYGGEFPTVNGAAQEGLVRFAVKSAAPNQQGPRVTGSRFNPTVASTVSGTVRLTWPANWDRDNSTLKYDVIRDGNTTKPIYTTTADSTFWNQPQMGFVDTGLVPGQSYRYRVFATDPSGNIARSDTVTIVATASGQSASPYSTAVMADAPNRYYRLGDAAGTTVEDWAGFNDGTVTGTPDFGKAGQNPADSNTAVGFKDGSYVTTPTAEKGPNTFTVESWVKTTSTDGGKIIGFGSSATGSSASYDRMVYMSNDGTINFGVYTGQSQLVSSSKTYNDGEWHHVAATLSPAGMTLTIDGRQVGSRSDVTQGQDYTGYWRIAGDNLGGWPNKPNSDYLTGDIDEVAIYSAALTQDQLIAHYVAAGRTSPIPPAPADAYGASVYNLNPTLYWRLGESSGTTAADSGKRDNSGLYFGAFAQQTAGALKNVGDTAATFSPTSNGFGGWNQAGVSSASSSPSTTSYTEELWFKTTTTSGGKLIGFGSSQTGTSGNYDRHVYMENDGRLTFGVWTGNANTATTSASYNDGQWHHLVASESSPDGMKLYVDGKLKATNPQTGGDPYTGYWRVAGDNAWSGDPFFKGSIDEVAVYPNALTSDQVADHYRIGAGIVPNVRPVAAFTSTVTDLSVAFDASGSADQDGTIATYAWDFGDGQTATGATPTHAYSTAGDHAVALTVTDNSGESTTLSHTVTTNLANVAPTASFTSTVTDLSVAFYASGSTDSDGSIASYSWNFGDGSTGTGVNPSHAYAIAGSYPVTLNVTDNKGLISDVTKTVVATAKVLVPPTSAFTKTATGLSLGLDGSASTDADGTIASYAWTFGDGQAGSGATTTHAYASAGTFQVSLTVTDNDGASATSTQSVTLTAPPANVVPTASFTSSAADLATSFDATASTDADGTIASYAWAFGDGSTGTGATASHSYAAAGSYTVILTVTDNVGATGTSTKTLTVTAPAQPGGPLATDTFTRTSTSGLGSAEVGGSWNVTGGVANATVSGNKARLKATKATAGVNASLSAVSTTSSNSFATFALDKLADGGGTFFSLAGRQISSGNDYRAKIKVAANGALTLTLGKTVATAETALKAVNLTGSYVAGTEYRVRTEVTGTNPTTVRAKVWAVTQTEPAAWQATADDTTAALQSAGTVGVMTYLSGSSSNFPLVTSIDDLSVATVGAVVTPPVVTPPVNAAPVAAFTSSNVDLTASVDASTSTDSDGTIASYAWNFGDGATATGVTASHAFASAGSYQVTLTVTDNSGATATVTKSVSVTAPVVTPPVVTPPAGAVATDAFERTAVAGLGSADVGGAWTVNGGAANASVAGGKGVLTSTKGGAGLTAFLPAVSSSQTNAVVNFSVDKLDNGAGQYVSLAARQVSAANDYRAKVKIASNGALTLTLQKTVAGAETALKSVAIAGAYVPGVEYSIRVQATGAGTTSLAAKIWPAGQAEPAAWQLTADDTTTQLQAPGAVALVTYLSGSSTNFPIAVSFDNLGVTAVQ